MQAEHVVAASACRVFLVEDHPLFRKGVADLLRAEKDFTIAGEADSAPVALAALREIPADLVVLDISLRGADGLELIKSLRAEHPDILILVLSMHDEEIYALRALRAGAHGYITKLEAGDSIVAAVRQIRAGRFYLVRTFRKRWCTAPWN